MRILLIIAISALVGTAVGASIAYIEVRSDAAAVTAPRAPTDAAPAADSRGPRVHVDDPTYDFGTMQRGTTKSHDFVLANVGTAPLTLRVGSTTCKCAIGTVDDAPIPPGESVKVTLEWSAKSEHGPFRQSATILTNDPLQSQVHLTIDGTVTEASGVYPRDLVFDKVPAGESKSAQLYVMAMLQDDLQVTDPELSDPKTSDLFDIEIEPVEPESLPDPSARAGVRVTVTAQPGLPIGRLNQWLSLKTSLPDAERLEIPLVGRVVGDISVHGPGWIEEAGALALGSVKSSAGASSGLTLMVRGEGAADVKFEVASTDPPELQAAVGESNQLRENLAHVPLTIEVPPGTRPMVHLDTAQSEAGRVVLRTTHPKVNELVIGVRFAVER